MERIFANVDHKPDPRKFFQKRNSRFDNWTPSSEVNLLIRIQSQLTLDNINDSTTQKLNPSLFKGIF